MPVDRPGRRRWERRRTGLPRTQGSRPPAAQRQAAEWWSLALRRFRDYVHRSAAAALDADRRDADDPDR